MIPDYIELEEGDVLMIHYYIGSIPSVDVDKHCKRVLDAIGKVFGVPVLILPQREKVGERELEFTVIKTPSIITRSDLKKVAKSMQR
jgi:hypothetical protein